MKTITKLWILIGILIILSPVGIILPRYFKSGAAWGEWNSSEMRALIGYLPEGMGKFSSIWKAPMPGYAGDLFGYLISAMSGIVIIAGIIFLISGIDKMGKRNRFLERSVRSAVDFFKEAVFSEEIARSEGLLQSINPVVKTGLLLILLALTIFASSIRSLTALYLLSILLAILSGINSLYFIKRVWFFIPIFTLLIAIPVIFTHNLLTAALFILRVADCVSFVVLVTITTRHNQILKSLRSFGVPAIFIKVLDMMYRYIFLFIRIFEEMHLSLKSRLVRSFNAHDARRWISSRIAFIFKRSLKMSEDVYMAMIARGYGIGTDNNGK